MERLDPEVPGTFAYHFYHYDGHGSVTGLSDETETLTDTYTYEAWGTVLARTGTTENRYQYTGEQYDPNLGFTYLRARYYNATLGRFHTLDTWQGNSSDPITLHKYLYANANPVTYVDPSGHFSLIETNIVQLINKINLVYQVAQYTYLIINGRYDEVGKKAVEDIGFAFLFGVFGKAASWGLGILGKVGRLVSKLFRPSRSQITLFHGTSSNIASKIVGSKYFKQQGFRNFPAYFGEDFATARYFAFERLTKYPPGTTLPKNLTVIKFKIPEWAAKKLGLLERIPHNPPLDIPGGSGFERVLENQYVLEQFNDLLQRGIITFSRTRVL